MCLAWYSLDIWKNDCLSKLAGFQKTSLGITKIVMKPFTWWCQKILASNYYQHCDSNKLCSIDSSMSCCALENIWEKERKCRGSIHVNEPAQLTEGRCAMPISLWESWICLYSSIKIFKCLTIMLQLYTFRNSLKEICSIARFAICKVKTGLRYFWT